MVGFSSRFPFFSERTARRLCIAGLCILSFVGGAVTLRYGLPPAGLLNNAFESAEAWKKQLTQPKILLGTAGLNLAMADSTAAWDKNLAYPGYTLVSIRYSTSAYLLDMDGRVIHHWSMPLRKAWPYPNLKGRVIDESRTHITKSIVFPNGDLLALMTVSHGMPYGYGIVKMDKDSNVIWTYDKNTHHDFYIDRQNGNIYTLTHEMLKDPLPGLEKLPYPMLNDYIVILSPQGKEIDRIDIAQAFADTPFELMLYHAPKNISTWDTLHTNSVMKLEPETAKQFPMFRPGQLLISIRNMNAVAVIDPKTRKVVWAYNGLWRAQHAAQFLDNGHILLFDNKGHVVNKRPYSRLIEFDPKTLQATWSYVGSESQPFYTPVFGRAQRLPNGNTLATDSLSGRIFEATPEKKIAWEFQLPKINLRPVTIPKLSKQVHCEDVCPEEQLDWFVNTSGIIVDARRYPQHSLPFLKEQVTLSKKRGGDATH